ncbi:hypothetical protein [Adhaeretor mobilis]|uniref:Uncharacterized protein n=1 Tax=Adhaeretor mobilis TaxID=1930276 RepID=A0A517MRT7_9BACT|nr:hypothetical protein [Adhaeretor mobilis]QDS97595.1 hypothetical protein HG15A2_08580 [Adhaeretor mobilis]
MSDVVLAPVDSGPLSLSQKQEVAAASERSQKIRKAAAVAKFNGWTTGILATCSAPFALFSLAGFFITTGMSVVAYNEFRGRRRLLEFDEEAPAFLGWNQVGFLALIITYCLWMLAAGLSGEGPFQEQFAAQPELAEVLGSPEELDHFYRGAVIALYGSVIALSMVFQGLNAYYYFSRRRYTQAYLTATPGWVIDLQRLVPSGS